MNSNLTVSLGQQLDQARKTAQPIEQISAKTKLSTGAAYQIQHWQLSQRLGTGARQAGWKMGLTSEAKRRQMNLDSPLYGFLLQEMQIENRGEFLLAGTIHPKAEPEIAFLLSQDLPKSPSHAEVLASCSAVCAAIEILDSRYNMFKYFSLQDVIADNASSCAYVLGPWCKDFQNLDLKNLSMKMSVNGQLSQSGVSSAISGDPVVSVIQLCELLAEQGEVLRAGSVVLAGAATAAVELAPGMHVSLMVDGLESVEFTARAGVETLRGGR